MQHNSYRRWITLAIISFSGGVSFDLAYLRYIYQIPMAKFMGFSNTEIGLIMSTFGIAAIILYAPSGVIADKFSHRQNDYFRDDHYRITGSVNGNVSTAVGNALYSGRLCDNDDFNAVVGVD
ncbi:Inner membrane protein yqcE [Escherichia coli]|uniref:Inner membrane protein yqcE n=1 Tax=Escherichia coli TaxID=562 RepID=A0AAX2K6T7_ECOLX|nr:Inner membrane protein yqcE [Escherichia coli]